MRLYLASTEELAAAAVAAADKPTQIVVQLHLLKSRMQVAEAFHRHLEANGWVSGARVPRNAASGFVQNALQWSGPVSGKQPSRHRIILKWHRVWLKSACGGKAIVVGKGRTSAKKLRVIEFSTRRRARLCQGKPVACPWVGQELYNWFVKMRYLIDWKAVSRSCGKNA